MGLKQKDARGCATPLGSGWKSRANEKAASCSACRRTSKPRLSLPKKRTGFGDMMHGFNHPNPFAPSLREWKPAGWLVGLKRPYGLRHFVTTLLVKNSQLPTIGCASPGNVPGKAQKMACHCRRARNVHFLDICPQADAPESCGLRCEDGGFP